MSSASSNLSSASSKPSGDAQRPALTVSLRLRVAAWIAAAVLLAGALVLAAIRTGVRQALLHELDASLIARADEIVLERAQLEEEDRFYELMELQARAQRGGEWFLQLLTPEREVLYATSTTPKSLTPLVGAPVGRPATVDHYRLIERRSDPPGQVAAIVQVGSSLADLQADMARIDRLVGIAALSVLLAAPVAGYGLATIALRPISEMTERTDRLQPHSLRDRLPLRGTGDELDRLAMVINNLLGKIAQYVGEHRGLMANAAHQLRTPLAAIRTSVEVILSSQVNAPENQDLLEKVVEQIESLETLVNQLLLLAETEVDSLRLASESVPLDAIVLRSLEMFEAVAESRGVQLVHGAIAPTTVAGNRHHLRQVINNLIDNAVKFTSVRTDGPRQVTLGLTHDLLKQRAVLKVSDNGIGISPENLPHVFDRFYREHSVERSEAGVRGNGLGLAIVKAVVESHGGEISVESTPGTGTTFTVSLPYTAT